MLPLHRLALRVRAHVQSGARQQQPPVLGHVVVVVVVHGPMVGTVLVPRVAGVVVLRVDVRVVRPAARALVVLAVPERGREVALGHRRRF